jgi:hypothetical protein
LRLRNATNPFAVVDAGHPETVPTKDEVSVLEAGLLGARLSPIPPGGPPSPSGWGRFVPEETNAHVRRAPAESMPMIVKLPYTEATAVPRD